MQLQQALPAISALGAQVVAVSVDPLDISRSLAQQLHLGFPILADSQAKMGSAFHVFNLTGGMNMGAVDRHSFFVIGPTGHIDWERLSLNQMYVPMSEVLTALKALK